MTFVFETVLYNACQAIQDMINSTDFTDMQSIECAAVTVDINDNYHIFATYNNINDSEWTMDDIYLWISIEKNNRDGWDSSVDEQMTHGLSSVSIEATLRQLLRRLADKIDMGG